MDSRDGFDNNRDKPFMSYSEALRKPAHNKTSKPLLKHGKQNVTQHCAEDKSWISKFEPSPFLGLKATVFEPSKERLFEDNSYSLPGHLSINDTSYTADNTQETCLSSLDSKAPLVEPSQQRLFENNYSYSLPGRLSINDTSYTAGNTQETCLSSLYSKAPLVEPSQQRLFENNYSYSLPGRLSINDTSYTAFGETAGNMQATCLSSLNKREHLDSIFQRFDFLSVSETNSRLDDNELTVYSEGHSNELAEITAIQSFYGSKLDKKIPNQTYYDSRLDKKLQAQFCYNSGLERILPAQTYYDSRLEKIHPTQACYDSGLDKMHPTQACYDSGLDKRLLTQPYYDSGLDKTHPIQKRYDSGLLKVSKLESRHFNEIESSRRSQKDCYSQSLPVPDSKNEVLPPVLNPCSKLPIGGNFYETNLACCSINKPVIGTFRENYLFKNISSGDNLWPRLPSRLLGDGTELKVQIGSSHLKDLIHLNIFLTGPAQCGQSTLLKTFVKRHATLPNNYDFNQGFIALISAFGKKILIKFIIIQKLLECQKELDLVKKDRICILVMVYSLNLPNTLRKIDVYVKKNKQYFINSRLPIVLVGSAPNSIISAKDTDKKFPTFEGGSSVRSLHSEVMKAFCKCSETSGEDVEQMFSLVMKLALFESA